MIIQSSDQELADLLETCAQEKINIPGMIQSHGILFVLDPQSLKILQASINAAQFFSLPLETIIGKDISELLNPSLSAFFKSAVSGPPTAKQIEIQGQRFAAMVHRSNGGILLELEQLPDNAYSSKLSFDLNMHFFLSVLFDKKNERDLLDCLVRQVQELTGFDRVLAYSFDKDFNGTVIAEAKNEKCTSYLDHSFPASDIPSQARELYTKNPIRQIVSVKDVSVPIFPSNIPNTDEALDLTYSILRAVSPIHIEYMKNMGTESSMSISIIVNDKLWGLLGCHHLDPKLVPRNVRSVCTALCQTASKILERLEEKRRLEESLTFERINLELVRKLTRDSNVMLKLVSSSPNLLDIVPATGAVVVWNGRLVAIGKTPSETEILALLNWLNQKVDQPYFETEFLSSIYEKGEKITDTAAGILAVKIPSKAQNWIIWFRAELLQKITWAGNPNKPVHYENNKPVINPRQSFAAWQEEVKGKSKSFRETEIKSALTLSGNLTIMERYHTQHLTGI